jgi:hypothetical protein
MASASPKYFGMPFGLLSTSNLYVANGCHSNDIPTRAARLVVNSLLVLN